MMHEETCSQEGAQMSNYEKEAVKMGQQKTVVFPYPSASSARGEAPARHSVHRAP